MQKLFTYVLYGLLLNIAYENAKNDKKVNTFWLKNAYRYIYNWKYVRKCLN